MGSISPLDAADKLPRTGVILPIVVLVVCLVVSGFTLVYIYRAKEQFRAWKTARREYLDHLRQTYEREEQETHRRYHQDLRLSQWFPDPMEDGKRTSKTIGPRDLEPYENQMSRTFAEWTRDALTRRAR